MISHISFEAPAQWDAIQLTWDNLATDNVTARIWARDHTVWKPKPDEISNRLGWQFVVREFIHARSVPTQIATPPSENASRS